MTDGAQREERLARLRAEYLTEVTMWVSDWTR